jgi:hypothetical protein
MATGALLRLSAVLALALASPDAGAAQPEPLPGSPDEEVTAAETDDDLEDERETDTSLSLPVEFGARRRTRLCVVCVDTEHLGQAVLCDRKTCVRTWEAAGGAAGLAAGTAICVLLRGSRCAEVGAFGAVLGAPAGGWIGESLCSPEVPAGCGCGCSEATSCGCCCPEGAPAPAGAP